MSDDTKLTPPTPTDPRLDGQAMPEVTHVDDPQDVVDQVLGETTPPPTILKPEVKSVVPQSGEQDIPLAFAGSPPPVPLTPPVMPAGLTPTPTAPQLGGQTRKMVKPKKSNKKKVIGIVAGVVLLLTTVVGGLVGYAYLTGESGLIARLVVDQNKNGDVIVTKHDNDNVVINRKTGKKVKKDNDGEWRHTSVYIPEPVVEPVITTTPVDNRSDLDKLNDLTEPPPGMYEVFNYTEGEPKFRYIQAPGVFEGAIRRAANEGNPADLAMLKSGLYGMSAKDIKWADKMIGEGLTWVPGGVGCNDMPERQKTSAGSGVDDSGNYTDDMYCNDWHWTHCDDAGSGMNGVGCDVVKTGGGGGGGDNPPRTITPTLACTSLTKDVASPKIGDELMFTCAGAVTPAGATVLAYDFRYRRNAGEWFDLTTNGVNTTFTVALAGEYDVQCRACGTINNASVCDPTWVGASQ